MTGSPVARWQDRFPPLRGGRSYMMDVDPQDAVELPDLRRLLAPVADAPPLEVILPADWVPWPPGDRAVLPGAVLEHFLIVSAWAEINAGGRTPCHEEHFLTMAVTGQDPCDPVVICPLLLAPEAGPVRPGLLPVLLPRPGYDTEPQVFVALRGAQAAPYRYVSGAGAGGGVPLRLRQSLVPGLQSALYHALSSA